MSEPITSNPTFVVYAITTVVLVLDLLFLWVYSGIVRAGSKTAINEEDAKQFGSALIAADPPEVARVLRAHRNAEAAIYPFLALGLVFVLAGGSAGTAKIVFGIFAAARWAHTFIYLAGKQPWRAITFVTGLLATIALLIAVVRLVM
jgi:uncharacterized MAPEG superfamily protein